MPRRKRTQEQEDQMVGAQVRIAAQHRATRVTQDRDLIRRLRSGNVPLTESIALARILELLVDADLRRR